MSRRHEKPVVAVLPALVDQAIRVAAAVLDKSIAVTVAVSIEPRERSLDARPQFQDSGEVAGTLKIGACEHNKERRGINAAEVAAEWNFAKFGHFSEPHFVQDLAGLGVGLGVDLGGLAGSKLVRTPRAIAGSSHSVWSAVISASRPK